MMTCVYVYFNSNVLFIWVWYKKPTLNRPKKFNERRTLSANINKIDFILK